MAGMDCSDVRRRMASPHTATPREVQELNRREPERKTRLSTEEYLLNLTRKLDWGEFLMIVTAAERLATDRVRARLLQKGRRKAGADTAFKDFLQVAVSLPEGKSHSQS